MFWADFKRHRKKQQLKNINMRKVIWQKHHIHYPGEDAGERVVKIRKGVHAAITILRRFNFLTKDEVEALHYEAMQKLEIDERGLNSNG